MRLVAPAGYCAVSGSQESRPRALDSLEHEHTGDHRRDEGKRLRLVGADGDERGAGEECEGDVHGGLRVHAPILA